MSEFDKERLLAGVAVSTEIEPAALPRGSQLLGHFTPEEFGAAVGRSRRWVDQQIALGHIAHTRIGRTVLIPPSAIPDLLKANEKRAVRQQRKRRE